MSEETKEQTNAESQIVEVEAQATVDNQPTEDKPVKIADLATRMIQLCGAKDVKIEYTGLRQGEKLFEELLNVEETTKPSFHKKIRIADVKEYDYETVCRKIDELFTICERYDKIETVRKMKQIVPEYRSQNSVYEKLDEALR